MKKRMFGGRPDDGSSDDAEREAAAELARLTRQARPQSPNANANASASAGYGGGLGAAYRSPGSGAPPPPAGGASLGSLPVPSFAGPDDEDDDGADAPFSIRAEEEAVTEMALRDWAAQNRGARSFEDYALVGIDRVGAEAQRDRALREALERQKRMSQEIAARRAEAFKQGAGPEAARLPGRAANANLGRPNITYATSAPGAMRTNVARQDAIVAAGKERAARAARPKPTGPLLTPAARRAKAAEDKAAAAKGAGPKKATAKAVTTKAAGATKAVAKKAAAATKATPTKAATKAAATKGPVAKAAATKRAAPPGTPKAVAPKPARVEAVPPKAPRAVKAPAATRAAKVPAVRARPGPAPAAPAPAAPAPEQPPEPEDAPRLLWPAARRALAAQQAAAAAEEQAPSAQRRGAGRSPA